MAVTHRQPIALLTESCAGRLLGVSDTIPNITIPANLLPADGRFGSGPSKVRTQALDALAATGTSFMGTSHRQDTVKDIVLRMQDGMRQLFSLPSDWDVIIGNGGATILWDALTFGFIDQKSQHLSFGEFGSKFAKAVQHAPHLSDPTVIESAVGSHPALVADDTVDTYCFTHNETSTGVAMDVTRPAGAAGLMCVDATSAAGGMRWSPDQADLYYFSPQKCFASDGGLYIALASPAASARIDAIAASDRWIPAGLDLKTALDNSRKKQTYNTPALATIFMTMHMAEWMNENGGLDFAAGRCDESSSHIYDWADAHDLATPFVSDLSMRSSVVCTIDFDDAVAADTIASVLAANGIVGTESYRKLGRNQLRLAAFPAIDPDDTSALTACIDHVIGELA
jgi:phosphoserine aminotransferase